MRAQTAEELRALLEADETAVRIWLQSARADAESIVADPAVPGWAKGLDRLVGSAGEPRSALASSPDLANLRRELLPKLKALGYHDFILADRAGHVLAEGNDDRLGETLKGYPRDFLGGVLAKDASVSLPFVQSQSHPQMLSAAPLLDEGGRPFAALGLAMRPEDAFTRIMQVARFGQTGETYAFDRRGRLISESRFDDQLKKIGLLPDESGASSILSVDLRNPRVDMVRGGKPLEKRASQPLTVPAAAAIAGGKGVDVSGYRDYRGIPSIGAWTWLDEYDFGMITELDAEEALRPILIVRWTFWTLFSLLAMTSVAIFVFTIVVERQRRAIRLAALEARTLGQYTLEEKIGSGGMGSVYRARHAHLRRPTAVKLMDPDRVNTMGLARFEREAQATGLLTHPNTIIVYDYGATAEGLFYYAMEYLEGINLSQLVDRFGAQPEARVVSIMSQACGSLAEAHDAGLIHRDIKPANLFLTCRGGIFDFVKVLDFGLVKSTSEAADAAMTAPDAMPGTPSYLSPEAIARVGPIDHRADLYALGAVGYFLLTGTPVFDGRGAGELLRKHAKAEPDSPSQRLGRLVTPALEAILLRCLAKRPEARPTGARELREALAACEGLGLWTQVEAEAWWRTSGPPARRADPSPPLATGAATMTMTIVAARATEVLSTKSHEKTSSLLMEDN